jgi:hypothetical protein
MIPNFSLTGRGESSDSSSSTGSSEDSPRLSWTGSSGGEGLERPRAQVGIVNEGKVECYMIAVIVALSRLPEFVKELSRGLLPVSLAVRQERAWFLVAALTPDVGRNTRAHANARADMVEVQNRTGPPSPPSMEVHAACAQLLAATIVAVSRGSSTGTPVSIAALKALMCALPGDDVTRLQADQQQDAAEFLDIVLDILGAAPCFEKAARRFYGGWHKKWLLRCSNEACPQVHLSAPGASKPLQIQAQLPADDGILNPGQPVNFQDAMDRWHADNAPMAVPVGTKCPVCENPLSTSDSGSKLEEVITLPDGELVVHVARFHSSVDGVTSKKNRGFKVGTTVTIGGVLFLVRATVLHCGSLKFGHYTMVTPRQSGDPSGGGGGGGGGGEMTFFNDSSVALLDPGGLAELLAEGCFRTGRSAVFSPYLVFLSRAETAAELAAAAELVTRDREVGSAGSQSEDEHEGSTGHPRLGGTLRLTAPLRPLPMPAAPYQLRMHSHVNGSNARAQLDNTLRRKSK